MGKEKSTSVYFDRDKMSFVGLSKKIIDKLKLTYENIDVDKELKKMELWLSSPKGIKRKGEINFILNWLNNAMPKSFKPSSFDETEPESALTPFLREYRKDLWKGREHILAMNKRKS